MSLADISKAFDGVGKLTGADTWPMWKFRVETALDTILQFYSMRGGTTAPRKVTRGVFNVMTAHIADSVMANYLNESKPHVLMDKLKERFDPKTTMNDANDIFQLFHLRRHVWKMDKLLDDAQNIVSRLAAKGTPLADNVFYSAIVGIIPPAYAHTRAAYEAGVRASTSLSGPVEYKPHALIAELRREFNNYRLTYPKPTEAKGLSTLVPRNKPTHKPAVKDSNVQRTQKTGTARAAAAASCNTTNSLVFIHLEGCLLSFQ